MTLYNVHPIIFLDEDIPDNGGCVIHSSLWSRWSTEITDLMLVKITYNDTVRILHVQTFHNNTKDSIYIPPWCFNIDNSIKVRMELLEESPPIATKITLQPLDIEAYHCDISTTVSECLSNWQVLSTGTTITIPIPELGGFLADFFVKSTEPSNTVLLRGEVPFELEESIETVTEWIKKISPQPSPLPVHIPSTNHTLFPVEEELVRNVGFVPFSGKGHRLC